MVVIDIASQTVVGTTQWIGITPVDIAFTPDGVYAFVSHIATNGIGIEIINRAAITVLGRTTGLPAQPGGLVVTTSAPFVGYQAGVGAGCAITEFDVWPGSSVGATVSGLGRLCNASDLALSPDGATLYATMRGIPSTVNPGQTGGGISVISTATNAQTDRIFLDDGIADSNPREIAVSADGQFAVVSLFNTDEVAVIDLTTNTVVQTIAVGDGPSGIAIPGNGPAPQPPPSDTDADGIPDADDNCTEHVNPDQSDVNGNGVGDPCDPVHPDMVGFWGFDEGTGQVIADATGTGNVGQLGSTAGTDINDPTWTVGQFGGGMSYDFDGTSPLSSTRSEYVFVSNDVSLEPAQISVEAWVRMSADPGSFSYLLRKGVNACSHPGYSFLNFGSGDLRFLVAAQTTTTVSSPSVGTTAIYDGQWHHFVGTYDEQHVRLYVDGVEIGAGTPHTEPIRYNLPTDNDLYFGAYEEPGGCRLSYKGDLDDVAIWNRAITPAEVAVRAAR